VPGGFALLLALVKWRRWEGRFLAAFALIPQTTHLLAALPVLLLPSTLRGKAILAALTFLPNFLMVREPWASRLATTVGTREGFAIIGALVLWTVLIPALTVVLLRPNTARAA
jgi:hypothetical protein